MGISGAVIQSAINFSEGRNATTIHAIVEAARMAPGVVVADWSADADHNRMVLTLLGGPDAVRAGIVAAAREAVARIDLRSHLGAHPRIGAVDVVPIVPIREITMEACVALSRVVAHDLGETLELPVYLYEHSAAPGRRSSLPDIRKGGFEALSAERMCGDNAPDFGPHAPHPTAGAVVLGARRPLAAYNIDLVDGNLQVVREVAAEIRRYRAEAPELKGVRALGLVLPSRGRAQVSMNLTRPSQTPMTSVFDYVRRAVEARGGQVWGSEIIGLIPRASLGGESPERILWHDYKPTQIIEYWL